ncbi:MAG: nuclear transport factor 2 family protein [Saprospiraceae bacterium]|nr:nuclear transport factor 2 family protein [Pyrinomonadaceae bacterium]
MRKPILLVALIIATSLSVFGQKTDKQSSKISKADQEIKALAVEFVNAVVKKDAVALERLLTDDFIDVSPGSPISSRAEFIDEYKNPPANAVKHDSAEIVAGSAKIRFYDDTALITARWAWRGTANGQAFSAVLVTTLVGAKKNGRWQVMATHSTFVPKTTANSSN